MNATERLHHLGQSLWLDEITRDLLNNGMLQRYIDEFFVTGLASNPTVFEQAIKNSRAYDIAIQKLLTRGKSGEELFFNLALEDITRAADLFHPIYRRTNGVDGWVSLEVSPKLAYQTDATIEAALELHARADRSNFLIKIPGTPEGLLAIEEAIFLGVPVNVTLLFSTKQYLAAADAFMRGVERRIEAGLNPHVGCVASVFVSHWDAAVAGKIPPELNNQLGIAAAQQTYKAYRNLLVSPRWQRAFNAGARPQRLLWASTVTNDSKVSDIIYVKSLAAPYTINTMPEPTLKAVADHSEIGETMAVDCWKSERVLADFTKAGIKLDVLAGQLQQQGAKLFEKSWADLLTAINSKAYLFKSEAIKSESSWRNPDYNSVK